MVSLYDGKVIDKLWRKYISLSPGRINIWLADQSIINRRNVGKLWIRLSLSEEKIKFGIAEPEIICNIRREVTPPACYKVRRLSINLAKRREIR